MESSSQLTFTPSFFRGVAKKHQPVLDDDSQHIDNILTGWWFQTCFIFHDIRDVILPIDELTFFNMVIAPPTS